MVKGKILVMVVAIVFLSAGVAWATAVTGIKGTKHDLSVTGAGPIKAALGQQGDEICIWCHTPHHANMAFVGAPLWSKATPAGAFTMYGAIVADAAGRTIAGTLTAATPSPITMACLSCHDGVSAINSLVNQAGAGTLIAPVGTHLVPFGTGVGATPAGTARVMPVGAGRIGTELRDDHPVSIPYIVGVAGLRPTGANLMAVTGRAWHRVTTVGDLLRGTSPMVECSSCHDPHVGGTAHPMFLRTANTGSALCFGCHAM